MTPRTAAAAVVCVTLLAGAVAPVLHAQAPVSRATLTARAGSIAGLVVDGHDRPVAGAHVRLRDVTSGRVLMTDRCNENGQFRFAGVPSGSYVAELVDDRNNVRAIGQTVVVSPGQTVNTVIRLGANARWYEGFFANAGRAAVASAAGLGITAVGNGFQPASGRN